MEYKDLLDHAPSLRNLLNRDDYMELITAYNNKVIDNEYNRYRDEGKGDGMARAMAYASLSGYLSSELKLWVERYRELMERYNELRGV